MSLFSTLGTGASGLGASSSSLAVIGDNIANIGTTGFKASRAQFADIFPQYIGTPSGPKAVGRGAMVNTVQTMFEQGSLMQTGGALDMAITGHGWFQVSGGNDLYYTRDGSFYLDKDGYVINGGGLRLQGYQAANGNLTSRVGDLQIDLAPAPQQVTTEITLNTNLAADAVWLDAAGAVDTPYAGLVRDGTAAAATMDVLSTAADYSTSVTVYDSLGVPHDVTVFFERTGANDWTWSAVVDATEVDTDGDGIADGQNTLEIANGTATFDGSGNLTGFTENAAGGGWTWPGADPWTFTLDVGLSPAGAPLDGQLTMVGDTSTTTSISQDGYPQGELLDLQVGTDGIVTGVYDNGESLTLGQVATALFDSEQGLERLGGNMFRATRASGDPALGAPGEGGRGGVAARALERSAVDLEEEFIAMIQAQRSYQANAGVIRTADETLQELVNLV